MLIPLRPGELERLIPAVATGNQFKQALGNPRKILQRVMISSIGGVITLVISQSQITSRFYSLWLISGVVFLLYILWGPIAEASRINAKLRKYPIAAIFYGNVSNVETRERVEKRHEQANSKGQLELIEDRRTWIILDLEDEDGYLSQLQCPLEQKYQFVRNGMPILCLVFSNYKDFRQINYLSDAWFPSERKWLGQYPYLLRPAFEELCNLRINKKSY